MIIQQTEEVKDGRKTLTQRIEQDGETAVLNNAGVIVAVKDKNGRMKWRVGGRYAIVPKRGQHGIGFIRITEITRVSVQNMTEKDALDEGVANVAEYRELWGRINRKKGRRWADNPTVWRIRFEVSA